MSPSTEGATLRKIGEMKRLIPIIAAAVALAGPLALGGVATAKDHKGADRGERSSDRGGQQRGGERNGDERRGGDERARAPDRGVYPGRGGPPQGWREGRGEPERGERRAYEAGAPAPYPVPNARRGGYMPPQAGAPVHDYGRYRLRPPPRGFTWVRTGNGYAMVSQDGRVFDVVPY
jgi:Ni/Co efflux regulator RcnB